MGWQPIDTAPKDGTHFAGYCDDDVHSLEAVKETWMGKCAEGSILYQRWLAGEIPRNTGWEYVSGNSIFTWNPTHWQPLPAPPTT